MDIENDYTQVIRNIGIKIMEVDNLPNNTKITKKILSKHLGLGPEIINGVRASSIKIESTSSTTQ